MEQGKGGQGKGIVVVGTDGSEHADVALRWALAEARLRGAVLKVVHAWQYLPIVAEPLAAVPPVPYEELAGNANKVVSEAIERATGGTDPGVEIEVAAIEGPAAAALIDAANDADLLVVGSRGRGGFKGLLLGSVSQQVTHHAPCPVVILPRSVHEHADR